MNTGRGEGIALSPMADGRAPRDRAADCRLAARGWDGDAELAEQLTAMVGRRPARAAPAATG